MLATCAHLKCRHPHEIPEAMAWEVARCPRCQGAFRARPPTAVEDAQRRELQIPEHHPSTPRPIGGRIVVLEDIRSQYNVGAMFRTADGTGWSHIYLTGITATPPSKGVVKTALGADDFVPWDYRANCVDLVRELATAGYDVIGLEEASDAMPLDAFTPPDRLALVVGNEVWGLSPEVRAAVSRCVQIPMRGRKKSFNASVAFGIAAYALNVGQKG